MKLRSMGQLMLLFAPLAVAQSSNNFTQKVTESNDAYHFNSWAGSPYNAAYTEWWYFNFYDRKDDLQAIFTYQVADPLNLTGQGGADLTAVVYHGNSIVPESDLYPLSAFSASSTKARVSLGANLVETASPDLYFVTGATRDGRLSWNLVFDRETESWFAGDHLNVAPAAWEQMSWLIYMRRAEVFGTLTLDGHTYFVNCSGYHDHNWGQWDFATVVWNWAQYSEAGRGWQPSLSFDLGDFVGNPNGRARIRLGDRDMVFSASQYKLVHTKWAYDKLDNLNYPVQSVFTADNGQEKVRITMDALKTAPLASGPPPSLVIYEQTAHFAGTVTTKEHRGTNEFRFEGDGFKEYTATSSPAL